MAFVDDIHKALNSSKGKRLSPEDRFALSEAAQYATSINDLSEADRKLARQVLNPGTAQARPARQSRKRRK
jgi:hypothetical protein